MNPAPDDVGGFHLGGAVDSARTIEVTTDVGRIQFVFEGSECLLDSCFSSGNGTLVYSWLQMDGETGTLSQNDQPLAVVLRCTLGVVLLAACLGQRCTDPGTITNPGGGDVLGYPPVDPASVDLIADAGVDQEVDEGTEVILDARLSSSNVGIAYAWVQTEGTPVLLSATDQPVVSFLAPAPTAETEILNFKLVVDTVAVSIATRANSLAAGPYSDTVIFTNTTNGSGNAFDQCLWDPNKTSPDASITAATTTSDVHGTYALRLTASDGAASSSDTVTVYVIATLSIDSTPAKRTAPLAVQLNATRGGTALTASDLPSGSHLEWDSGDGSPVQQGNQVSHTYTATTSLAAGSYTDAVTFTNTTNGSGNTTCVTDARDSDPRLALPPTGAGSHRFFSLFRLSACLSDKTREDSSVRLVEEHARVKVLAGSVRRQRKNSARFDRYR